MSRLAMFGNRVGEVENLYPIQIEFEKARLKRALFGKKSFPHPKIGRFELLEHLGAGGMGCVFRAWDPDLLRGVAVKVIEVAFNSDAGQHAVTKYKEAREAIALAQINHPNILTLYEAGVQNNRLYLVTEWIQGENLQQWFDSGLYPLREVVRIFRAIALGLREAHRRGIVHRDIKPSNILLSQDHRVCIADFGLAKVLSGTDERGNSRAFQLHAMKTQREGGTPEYMAPEQRKRFDGQPVSADFRSDQYSYFLCMYEALYQVWYSYVKTRRFAERRPGVFDVLGDKIPIRLRELLQTGLDPDPNRRHSGFEFIVQELDRVERSLRVPPRFWRLWGGVASSAAICAAALNWGLVQGQPLDDPFSMAAGAKSTSGLVKHRGTKDQDQDKTSLEKDLPDFLPLLARQLEDVLADPTRKRVQALFETDIFANQPLKQFHQIFERLSALGCRELSWTKTMRQNDVWAIPPKCVSRDVRLEFRIQSNEPHRLLYLAAYTIRVDEPQVPLGDYLLRIIHAEDSKEVETLLNAEFIFSVADGQQIVESQRKVRKGDKVCTLLPSSRKDAHFWSWLEFRCAETTHEMEYGFDLGDTPKIDLLWHDHKAIR